MKRRQTLALPPKVSIVLPVHGEGMLLNATLRNVRDMMAEAASHDVTSELVIVADRPSPKTSAYLDGLGSQVLGDITHTLFIADFGDPGPTRNLGVASATGEYIALLDGDNILSTSWLVAAVNSLDTAQRPTVVHPEYVVCFGGRYNITEVRQSSDPDFSYLDVLEENPWDTVAVMSRETATTVPYGSFPLDTQLGPEDWAWNIDSLIAGVVHEIVPDTVMFYRVKDAARSVNERRTELGSILPPYDIEKLATELPFAPGMKRKAPRAPKGRSVGRLKNLYARNLRFRRWMTTHLPRLARVMYLMARKLYRPLFALSSAGDYSARTIGVMGKRRAAVFLNAERRQLAAYEPQIGLGPSIEAFPLWEPNPTPFGEILRDAVSQIGQRPDYLLVLPWLGIGGADFIGQSYANAAQEVLGDAGRVVVLCEKTWTEGATELDPRVALVTLPVTFDGLEYSKKARLMSELVMLTQPRALHIINAPVMYDCVATFGNALSPVCPIFTTVFCVDRDSRGAPGHYLLWTADSIAPHLTKVFADNQNVVDEMTTLAGLPADLFEVHYQPIVRDRLVGELNSGDESPQSNRLRVLWAGRLDDQKRPEMLVEIAKIIRQRKLPIDLVAYGHAVLGGTPAHLLKEMARHGIDYRGKFSGGLVTVAQDFDAFLMTSAWEGLPLTMLEATDQGLPLVVPDVGGIREFVSDGETGLLISDFDSPESYVAALMRLHEDAELRRGLVAAAEQHANTQHSWAGFRERFGTWVS